MKNLPSVIAGIAGEYYVAGELSKRGFNVSLTIRNSKGIDIHASKLENNKIFAIQVKTSKEKKAKWILNKKSETNYNQNFFYIFVLLNDINQCPSFYIVPSFDLANCIKKDHQNWLEKPSKNGLGHKDNDIRNFNDIENIYLERWDLLI